MNRKLRLGILLDSYVVPAWVELMLRRIQDGDYAQIVLVVLNDLGPADPERSRAHFSPGWRRLPQIVFGDCLELMARKLMERQPARGHACEYIDAGTALKDIPVIKVEPLRRRSIDQFGDDDIQQIRERDLDVLVRVGFQRLEGDILDAARHGVWAYHHADIRVNRGGPPGYWETMESWPETGTVLLRQSKGADDDTVLYRSWSCTDAMSVTRNNNARFWTSASFLPRVLVRLHTIGSERFSREVAVQNEDLRFYSYRQYSEPTNWQRLKGLCGKVLAKARKRFRHTFFFDQWILLYAFGSASPTSLSSYRSIVPPRDRFWADPFVLYRDGTYYIFMEELVYADGIGHISLITLDEQGGYGSAAPVLEEPHHLSYPFVFEVSGTMYMVAEAYQARKVPLYRCAEFPDKWVFVKDLLEDVAAVDPTLLAHEGKWYLFVNVAENPGSSEWDELFVFVADDPVHGDWRSHPLNPVVSDVKRARPAGKILCRNGAMYRPSQDCSRHYGYGLNLNRIVRLDESEYEEKLTTKIEPQWDSKVKSVHTFSNDGSLTVLDAQRRRARYW